MDFQYPACRSHSPESMYSQSQYHSPYPSNFSTSHKKPLPPRVVKPTSRNGSPRHLGRRRTTTANVPVTRTRSVLDQQRSNLYPSSTPRSHARPVSWHPNSQMDMNFSNQDYLINMGYQSYLQPFTFHGTALANGLVTPMSYPVLNEPQIQELITPLEELSAQECLDYPADGYNNYQNWAHPQVSKDQMNTMDHMFPHVQPQDVWQWSQQTSAILDPPTAPSSPNLLPIQDGTQSNKEDEGEEELVGMGLYDSPADVQSSSLLFGGGFGDAPRTKHLKLAESFEPPESNSAGEDDKDDASDDDEEEEEDEEGGNGDDVEKEASLPTEEIQTLRGEPLPQQALNPHASPTLAGQSFYFDSEPDLSSFAHCTQQLDPLAMGAYQQHQYHQNFGYGGLGSS